MPGLGEQVQEILKKVDSIEKMLIGEPPDETKLGLVVRLDRLEQRQQLRDKFFWAIVPLILTNVAVSLWTSIN